MQSMQDVNSVTETGLTKFVTNPEGDMRLCSRSFSETILPGGSDSSLDIPLTGRADGPRQPQKRKANTRAAYTCPICQKGFGLLDKHLLECLSSYLTLSKTSETPKPPFEVAQTFHPVLPMFLPPPAIPVVSTTSSDHLELSSLRLTALSVVLDTDSTESQNTCRDSSSFEGVCPLCGKHAAPLMGHLEKCVSPNLNPKPLEPPATQFGDFEKLSPLFNTSPPKIPAIWIPVHTIQSKVGTQLSRSCGKSPRKLDIDPVAPELGKQRSPRSPNSFSPPNVSPRTLSPENAASYSVNALISPRKIPREGSGSSVHAVESKVKETLHNIKERRWIHESHSSSSNSHKRRSKEPSKKKERTTPFNLPLQELPAPAPTEEQYDNSVLKVPICTSGPTNADILKKFPEIDPKCFDLTEIAVGQKVVILSMENMLLCRMAYDTKVFADGHHAGEEDVQFILYRKDGHSGCRFKNVATHKYLMSRETFSNMNNYLTRFKKKQYHCLYYSKGTKEVLIGTGQERSMFRVLQLSEKFQKSGVDEL